MTTKMIMTEQEIQNGFNKINKLYKRINEINKIFIFDRFVYKKRKCTEEERDALLEELNEKECKAQEIADKLEEMLNKKYGTKIIAVNLRVIDEYDSHPWD